MFNYFSSDVDPPPHTQEDPDLRAVELFNEVQGIGPTLAKKLVYEYNCHTLEDLKEKDVPLTAQQQLVPPPLPPLLL